MIDVLEDKEDFSATGGMGVFRKKVRIISSTYRVFRAPAGGTKGC